MSFKTLASLTFGEFSRYDLRACRSRFGTLIFLVADAERIDEWGLPAIIRIADTAEEALKGLEDVTNPRIARFLRKVRKLWDQQ